MSDRNKFLDIRELAPQLTSLMDGKPLSADFARVINDNVFELTDTWDPFSGAPERWTRRRDEG
jgi:hypothetical protein